MSKTMRCRRRAWLALVALLVALAPGVSRAAEPEATCDSLAEKVALLQQQLAEVQRQLQQLQAKEKQTEKEKRLAKLKQAAAAEVAQAGESQQAPAKVDTSTDFVSGTRMQPQLNPEISVVGNMHAVAGNNEVERASVGEWEVNVQSYLDPFSRFSLTLSKPEDEGIEVEEGYVSWLHLGKRLALTAGRKRQQFGVLNRYHTHALDQVDLPAVVTESFGDDGLIGTGVSLDWTMPPLWATSNALTVEVMNSDNDVAFAGAGFKHPSYLARLKSYWDLTPSSYIEVGLNGLHGDADPANRLRHDFQAVDFAFNWYPASRELYRSLTVRGMLMRSDLDLMGGSAREAWGGYLYGQFKFSPRWTTGVRYDRVNDQRDATHNFWAVSPYLTLWQSEFVRLRAQGSYRDDNLLGIDRRLFLQLTVAAGPHKHDSY